MNKRQEMKKEERIKANKEEKGRKKREKSRKGRKRKGDMEMKNK